jgi:hypothetical protein
MGFHDGDATKLLDSALRSRVTNYSGRRPDGTIVASPIIGPPQGTTTPAACSALGVLSIREV